MLRLHDEFRTVEGGGEVKPKVTLEQIRQEVKRLDPNLPEDIETFQHAVLLLSALVVGADVMKLATFTGYKLEWIQQVDTRLRRAGIWKGKQTAANWAGEDGGLEFWMDVCVAEGTIERTKS